MRGVREAPPSRMHWAWLILAVGFVNLMVSYGIRLGFGVVLPEMIESLGLTRKQGGDIFNAYLLAYISVAPLTGILTDRFGPRAVIPLFGCLLGCGTMLMGTSAHLWQACLFFALTGIGGSAMWAPVVAAVQRWFAPARRGMALGILSTGFGLGYAIMGRLHPLIIRHFSWRHSWYFLGITALVMVGVNAILLRNRPEEIGLAPWSRLRHARSHAPHFPVGGRQSVFEHLAPATPPHARPAAFGRGLGRVSIPDGKTTARPLPAVREARFWIIGLSYFFSALALYLVTTYMVDYAKNSLRFPYEKASALATIHGLGQIVGVLTIPPVSDRLTRRRTLAITNCVISVSILGIILSGGRELLLYTAVGIFGVLYGAIWPLYGACSGDYFSQEKAASVIGAWTPFYGMGAIFAHRLAGQVRDATGTFTTAFAAAAVSAFVGAVLIASVRRVKPLRAAAPASPPNP